MRSYTIGIDFGTQSARALVVEAATGRELEHAVMEYPHGVMDKQLPDGTRLPEGWALHHPQDYIDCVAAIIPRAMRLSGIDPGQVIGIGIDCTASTVLPIDRDGTPLCFYQEFSGQPHAYCKLWKHHAAQKQANRMTQVAQERSEAFLGRYGGKISSEWMFPKLYQVLEEAPQIYQRAHKFIEIGDWIVQRMTGCRARSACMAGYKALWHKKEGYPSAAYFAQVDPRLADVVEVKLSTELYPAGHNAGEITAEAAVWTGLLPGTPVAVANVDAHVSPPSLGITGPGNLLMIMGTSTCHILMDEREAPVPGICGVVEDGVLPSLMGYEAGQCCVGDLLHWFVKNCVPQAYEQEAEKSGLDIHDLLTKKAERLNAGESGLMALDWWNGNRSVLVDADLSGIVLGMTLHTKPEEIYRALIEATAFGTRIIIDTFAQSGISVRELYACGGIAEKNKMMMQIYADVTGKEIRIGRSHQSPALGSAMFAAVAAGKEKGGYESIAQAAERMGGVKGEFYSPDGRSGAVYDKLYSEYKRLHDLFGRWGDPAVKNLRAIRRKAISL